jgi:hypothetical protein
VPGNSRDSLYRTYGRGECPRPHALDLSGGQTVVVDWTKRDRHGRIVGKLTLKGQDLGLLMVNEFRGQCGSAMPRNLVGEIPTWVIASHEPSIEPCGANGNGRVDA